MKKYLYQILFIAVIISCGQRVPVTNRRQMNMIPEGELITMAGTQYNEFLKTANVLNENDSRSQQVIRVGTKIQNAAEQYLKKKNRMERVEGFNWTFKTVDDPTINAWCMPGGKVVVYTGILNLIKSDDELAVVMGHEISHAIARHGNERMSQAMLAQGIGGTFGALMGNNPSTGAQLFLQVYGIGSTLGVLKYSRKHETEADKIGLIFAKMAGYDPNAAITFWTKMSESGGAAVPEILSTHPSDERRIQTLKEFIPEIDSYIN